MRIEKNYTFTFDARQLEEKIKKVFNGLYNDLVEGLKSFLEENKDVNFDEDIINLIKKEYEVLSSNINIFYGLNNKIDFNKEKFCDFIIKKIVNVRETKSPKIMLELYNDYYFFVLMIYNLLEDDFFSKIQSYNSKIADYRDIINLLDKNAKESFLLVWYPKLLVKVMLVFYDENGKFRKEMKDVFDKFFMFVFNNLAKQYKKNNIFSEDGILEFLSNIKELLNINYNNFRGALIVFYSIIFYLNEIKLTKIWIVWLIFNSLGLFNTENDKWLVDEVGISDLYDRIEYLLTSNEVYGIMSELKKDFFSIDNSKGRKEEEKEDIRNVSRAIIISVLLEGKDVIKTTYKINKMIGNIIKSIPWIEEINEENINSFNEFINIYKHFPKLLKRKIYDLWLIDFFIKYPFLSKLPTELIEKIIADEEFQNFIEKYGASQEIVKEEFKRLIIKYSELLELDIVNKLNIDLSLEWLLENFKNINDYIHIWKQFFQVQELLNYIQIFNLWQHYEWLEKKIKIVLENIDLKWDLKIISNKIKNIQSEIKKSGVENAINKRKKYREKRKWDNVLFNKIWLYVFDLSKNDKRFQEELFDLIFALSEDKAILLSDFFQKVWLETLNKYLKEKYSASKLSFFKNLLNIDNEYLLTLLNFENIDSVLLKISNFSFENKFREYFNIIKEILKSNLWESINDDDINMFENILKFKLTQMDITDYEKIDILIGIKDIFRKISKFNEDVFLNFYIWFQEYLKNDTIEDFIVFIEKIEQLINIHLLTENKDIILDKLEDVSLDTLLKVIINYSILQDKKVLIKFIEQWYKIELYNQEPVVQQIEKTEAISKIEENIKTQAISIIGKSPTKWTYNDFVEFLNYLSKKWHEVVCLKDRGKGDHEIWKVNDKSFAIPYRGNKEYPPKTAYAIFKYILKGVLKKNL